MVGGDGNYEDGRGGLVQRDADDDHDHGEVKNDVELMLIYWPTIWQIFN